MKIELWPIGQIKPYENNPRLNDGAVDAVARSIAAYGFKQPIVVDKDGVIVVGHTRLKAAMKLGLEQVPVHVADNLSEAEVMALALEAAEKIPGGITIMAWGPGRKRGIDGHWPRINPVPY